MWPGRSVKLRIQLAKQMPVDDVGRLGFRKLLGKSTGCTLAAEALVVFCQPQAIAELLLDGEDVEQPA